jgi:hypothetical protein
MIFYNYPSKTTCFACRKKYDDHKCRCQLHDTRYHLCSQCGGDIPKEQWKEMNGKIICYRCISGMGERTAIAKGLGGSDEFTYIRQALGIPTHAKKPQ